MANAQDSSTLVQLRQELKTWERSFAASHGGRKANRDDIKADAGIAAKYKQYDQLSLPQKRRAATPRKTVAQTSSQHDVGQPHAFATPSKSRHQHLSPKKSPECVLSPTPQALRQRLGPTPLKDGQILSLFESTPSKDRTALAPMDLNVAATPSRKADAQDLGSEETENGRLGRTPTSSGKRYLLDTFATPMKRKREETAETPSGTKGVHATPQFLRRTGRLFKSALDPLEEEESGLKSKPDQPPFKKRSLVRSLSSIIRGMKTQIEEEADEDLEMLREMEAEEITGPTRQRQVKAAPADVVPETQIDGHNALDDSIDMPLGPDMPDVSERESSDDDASGLTANGQPRKVWKKKGQKRQTKRVKMRPAPRQAAVGSDQDQPIPAREELHAHSDGGSDFGGEIEVTAKSTSKPVGKGNSKGEANSKKKKRKVNELAHANFCRLKIKNKNSKAKGGGRFGRR